ncbi:LOW QUALITY PROTEIN: tudor domain-containing protein 6 [Porphyrio hochstetteri]
MSRGPGMLGPGAAVTLRICAVGLRPEVPVVRLWGLLGERSADYVRLRHEIQAAVGPRLAANPGPSGLVAGGAELRTGDLALVEMVGLWYRCCVVSCRGQDYRVFLLDEGCTVVTSAYYLARGRRELFQQPPEVLGCIVADVMPSGGPRMPACRDAPLSTWTVEAMEFLSHLHSKEVCGLVQEVMTPQLIVLALPQLTAQMHHLGLARQVAPSWFLQVLRHCLNYSPSRNRTVPQAPACSSVSSTVSQLLHVLLSHQPVLPSMDYFYPKLQLGVTEPVIVTHVSDPHRIYCQLQSLSQEISCLSDTMGHAYDRWEPDLLLKVGSPCAARSIDGQWYRAVLLEVIAGEQDQEVALVVFVDYGRKEMVPSTNLRHLPVECFRMPVVTYPCALQGISARGSGWSPVQMDELKALVLGKGVSAHIEAFNTFEHLYYVTLYGENGVNLNHLFGVQACCLVRTHMQVSQTEARGQLEVEESTAEEPELPPGVLPVAFMDRDLASAPVLGLRLKLGAFHDAQVSHLRDPSEFWLQLHEHRQLFRQLRQSMWNFYSHATKLGSAGWDLQPGSLCCASGTEGVFYRAVIIRVLNSQVEVHLVDRGNMETVDRCAVKELVPRFRELPALALKCCLAGVSPLRGSWNDSSVSAFREMVLNKGLKVHFLSVQGDKYVVDIFDQSQLGEKSVSKQMARGGYGEYQRCEITEALQKSPDKVVSQPSAVAWAGEEKKINEEKQLRKEFGLKSSNRAVNSHATVIAKETPVAAIHSSQTSQSLTAQMSEGKENLPISWRQGYVKMKSCPSYGALSEVGSTVSVVVSYIESPGHFWCQLSSRCLDLKVLMAEIQEYCKNSSHPHAWPNFVCLARYSEDKKWYRALIINKAPSKDKVEVVYVDYGNRELVSLTDLRSIDERFLQLETQAFRCSLYNLIQPNGQDPFAWDEEATQVFRDFVDSSSCFELKCTVFALASINHSQIFSIVDLMTPFQRASQFLAERGVARPLSPLKPPVSSVQLHSYYYSMHDIKIGSEEDVYITHVDDPLVFYCQLQRHADVLAQLTNNISHLSETMTNSETSQRCRNLCLAKYTDDHWYRGVITKTKPNVEVFFVDFGNTETIEKENLLLLPRDAYDILLLPMQAIKCALSDVSYVSKEATTWFKQAVLERQLKAIVVAKESDGKLLMELFDGNTQINANLKEEFSLINNMGLCRPAEEETLFSGNTDVSERNKIAESLLNTGRPLERLNCRPDAQGSEGKNKEHFRKEDDVNLFQPDEKGDLAAGLLESDEMLTSKKDAFLLNEARVESLLSEMDAKTDTKSDAEGGCIMLENASDLLQQKIVPALQVLVYVSHVNDPCDFYVQLESDEAQLNSISESLNNGTQVKNPCGQLFQAGDLISAVYSEDNLWYRAVVKEKTSEHLLSVQYIDYGNTSVINVDQVHRLPEDLLSIPAISIHCFLGGLKCKKAAAWAEKSVLRFIERTRDVLVTCQFVDKVEDKWEVILSDQQGLIAVDLADENLESRERSCSTETLDRQENSDIITVMEPLPPQAQNECDCESFIWKFPEAGQTIKIYISVADGPEYFWSQSADAEDMNYIEEKIEEAENLGLKSFKDCRSCIKSCHVCLAKYSQDGKFYRAQVSSVEGDHVVVRHVDYGSEETVSLEMVRQIPSELLRVRNQAFACCLSGFKSSEGSWLTEAKEKFYDITKDLLIEAEVLETQENKASKVPLLLVKLEASGKNINEEMKSFWKANEGTDDNACSNLENLLKEKSSSNNYMGLCLERETPAVCGLAQEESESALLCSEPLLGVTTEWLNAIEANVSVEAISYMSGEADGGCESAEHQSNCDKDIPLSEGEIDNHILLEPLINCSPDILGSQMKAAKQELSEVPFQEGAELKAELTDSASADSLLLGNKQELQKLLALQVQSSFSDEMGTLVELDQLQTSSTTCNDLKELMLELEAFSAQSSFGEKTKEALETWSLEMQTALGSKAKERVLQQELSELPVVSEETEELAALKFLELLPSFNENLVPSVGDGENTVELITCDAQISLGEKTTNLEFNLSEIDKAEATEDWMEDVPPRVSSSGGRPDKQQHLKTHHMLSTLGYEAEQLLDLVLPAMQPSQQDVEEDSLGLEHAALRCSASSGSVLSFLTKDLMKQRPVCTVKSCDTEVEKDKEWQKKEDCFVEEWVQEDLIDLFKECGNTCVQSSGSKLGNEVGKKENENLVDCSAECSEYTCNLEGFAVGSKCVVWTSLKWCEAQILEVSEKGTRVLNLSSGNEEIVDPENVWNAIPDWACRSSEAITSETENFQVLPEESLDQEKEMDCNSDLAEDTHDLQRSYNQVTCSPCEAEQVPVHTPSQEQEYKQSTEC